jgi:hypothetical protein
MKSNHSKNINFGLGLFILFLFILIILVIFIYTRPNMLVGNLISPQCISIINFSCKNPSYQKSTAQLNIILSQNTGISWSTANFVFVPQGTKFINGLPDISFSSYPANTTYFNNGLKNAETVDLILPVNDTIPPIAIGTPAVGEIWAQYTTSENNTPQYVEMATINIKAS